MPTKPNRFSTESAMEQLAMDGYVVFTEALPLADLQELNTYAQKARDAGKFRSASVGRESGKRQLSSVRGDHSLWVDDWSAIPALQIFYQMVAELMTATREGLYLPAKRFEGHFAVYPPGAGYQAHLDRHESSPHRLLSVVLYLSSLNSSEGGELKLHNTLNQKDAEIKIRPTAGTLVIFLSAKIVHEVMPTTRERWSLTGWIRDDDR